MTIVITAQQRDLLYDEILDRLRAIDDIRLAIDQEDWEATQRMGTAFSDDLRLVTQDLGWGHREGDEQVKLTSPPDVLRRSMSRWQDALLRLDASEKDDREMLREQRERNHLVVEACRSVLADLDADGSPSRSSSALT